MRVCMVVHELLEFGGLEEIAATLAAALQSRGHQVSVLSMTWVPPHNQYSRLLQEQHVPLVRFPKWVWRLAPSWPKRERALARVMALLWPVVALLAGLLFIAKRRRWSGALASSRGWLSGQLWVRLIGPDRRETLCRLLLRWWCWRWRPVLLHIHGYTSFLPFVLDWAHARGLPVVYQEHQTPDPQFNWWAGFSRSINKAQVVVAASGRSAQALGDVCGVTRPIVAMAPIVVDPVTSGGRHVLELRETGGPLRITTIARLEVTKGLTYLLETIAQVAKEFPATQFRVYGEGSLRHELLAYAARLDLKGEQILAGSYTREELPRIMAQTDIFVLPSILEGLPLALLEAMSYGRPIVATCVGGNPDVIEDGVTGLLCRPGDAQCLAQKLLVLIRDAALRAKLGHAAREFYERGHFHPASVCDRFVSIYRQALEESRSRLNASR